jgi:predicted CXXCH cytochrome family protein
MERLIFVVLMSLGLLVALVPIVRRPQWVMWVVLASVLLALGVAWGWNAQRAEEAFEAEFLKTHLPQVGRPGGYVSSDGCAACHTKRYQSWRRTFHRTMTQWARPDTVRGQFDHVVLKLDGQTYKLSRNGDDYLVELDDPDGGGSIPGGTAVTDPPRVARRIGMLTGSHHMQVYWIPSKTGNLQVDLPFVYLFDDHRWVPMRDTFLRDPNIRETADEWNFDCMECHTTAGIPGIIRAEHTLDTHLGEMGIGCESCHGPGEKHESANHDPLRRYVLRLGGKGDPTIVNPARLPSKLASQICGQCHGVKYYDNMNEYLVNGEPFRPGQELGPGIHILQPTRASEDPKLADLLRRQPDIMANRFWPDGKVRVSGRDYNGLIDSPCYQRGELSCLSCHSMHESSPTNLLRAGMEGNLACIQCHQEFKSNDSVAAHTHHDPNSSGSLCYNCHMPYTTYGLLKGIRSHFIESPSVATTVSTGRPNGCNLCHLDKSLGWTDEHLTAWYGTRPTPLTDDQRNISAAVLWALEGDAGQRALAAWNMGWEPARRTSGERWLAPFLAQLLADPYPAVRYIAGHSLQKTLGFHDFDYDFIGTPPEQEAARLQALKAWRLAGLPDRTGPAILISPHGELQESTLANLLGQRDNRSMNLQE